MKDKHVTAIRLEDLDLLRNLVKLEGRPATEILHRSLRLYLLNIPADQLDDKVLLELKDFYARQPTQSSTPGASANLTKVVRTALHTDSHEQGKTSSTQIAKTRGRK